MDLEKSWIQRAKAYQKLNLKKIIGQKPSPKEKINLDQIIRELTDFQSTFTTKDLRKILAQKVQTNTDRSGFEGLLKELKANSELVPLQQEKSGETRYTSKEILKIESQLLEKSLAQKKSRTHVVGRRIINNEIKNFENSKSFGSQICQKIALTEEQKAMVYELTEAKGGVKIALGIAGSGKSFSLEVAKNCWEKAGFKVIGLAPTGKASSGLEQSTGIKSKTIDRFLIEHSREKSPVTFGHKSVYVIDEAGMIGSKKLGKLIEMAQENKAKVVLVGDTRQLQPIEAGGAARMLEQHLGSVKLQAVYRQKEKWQKEATKFFASGKAEKAIQSYKENGKLDVFSTPELAHDSLIKDYLKDIKNPKKSEHTQIILAATNQQTRLLNYKIRQELIEQKSINQGVKIGITNRFDEPEFRYFSVGDRLVFNKNDQKLGVSNGNFGKINSITKIGKNFNISVELKGQSKPKTVTFSSKNYKHFDLGYAATIHKSQGETVDKTFYLLSEKVDLESAYVAMSRHKKDIKIYFDRSSYTELLDWNDIQKSKNHEEKLEKITEKSVESMAKKASVSHQKDTSLDYTQSSNVPSKNQGIGVSR